MPKGPYPSNPASRPKVGPADSATLRANVRSAMGLDKGPSNKPTEPPTQANQAEALPKKSSSDLASGVKKLLKPTENIESAVKDAGG